MLKEWRIADTNIKCANEGNIIPAGTIYWHLSSYNGDAYRCHQCATVTWKKFHFPPPIPQELLEQAGMPMPPVETKVEKPRITLTSFSYAKGIPENAYIFDTRKLVRNPWKNPLLRKLNGLDREVQEWLERCSGISAIVSPATYILRHGKYYKGNYTNNVAIGCQGGRHRSVAIVEMVRKAVNLGGVNKTLTVVHRDLKIKGGSDVNVNDGDPISHATSVKLE